METDWSFEISAFLKSETVHPEWHKTQEHWNVFQFQQEEQSNLKLVD